MVLAKVLFLNESKAKVIVFGPSERDQSLTFDKQLNVVISSCFFQLRLLSKIKSFLSVKTLEIAIRTLITARLDYFNYLSISAFLNLPSLISN